MTRIWGAFARIPIPVVAAMLVVGGALIPVHDALVVHWHSSGLEEWPQWLGRLTVQWYWALLPAAALALWARRRAVHGRLGRSGAWLNLAGGPATYLVITAGALFQGVLGRGDLPTGFMAIEWLHYLIMPGMILAGIAMSRDAGLPRWQGPLLIATAVAAWLPFGGLVVGSLLAALLLTSERRRVLDSPVAATAP
jgi:hypothetical protein